MAVFKMELDLDRFISVVNSEIKKCIAEREKMSCNNCKYRTDCLGNVYQISRDHPGQVIQHPVDYCSIWEEDKSVAEPIEDGKCNEDFEGNNMNEDDDMQYDSVKAILGRAIRWMFLERIWRRS